MPMHLGNGLHEPDHQRYHLVDIQRQLARPQCHTATVDKRDGVEAVRLSANRETLSTPASRRSNPR